MYAAVRVSYIWLPCVPRSSSFSDYAEKLCHHKSGAPLILFIRLQRKLMLVLPGYSFYMIKKTLHQLYHMENRNRSELRQVT